MSGGRLPGGLKPVHRPSLPIDAIMFAVARWSSLNQSAASFVGANSRNGWAAAATHCPASSQA